MDRKTEYEFAKTVLILERMGLKEAAEKIEQEMTENEEEQVNEEEIAEDAEDNNLEEEHDCEASHPDQSHEEYMAKKNESISLKGMTKAELTETFKEIIKQKLNKRSE